jgi:RNA polymerase sigma factor (TIGR02999 family)
VSELGLQRQTPNNAPAASASAAVTRLLKQVSGGDAQAAEALLPLVYEQLRALAKSRMRQERPDHTLQATALVHEAYIRLVDSTGVRDWDGRWHFFAAAAEAMRRILVENARKRARLKRGGGLQRVEFVPEQLTLHESPEDLIALDEALAKLAVKHPEKVELVKLRYFAGLTIEEASETLGIGTTTAERYWVYARAWLYRELGLPGSTR